MKQNEMVKKSTLAALMLAALAAGSMAHAASETSSTNFSADIETHTPMKCELKITPPASTTSAAIYTPNADSSIPGRLTSTGHIDGPLVIEVVGTNCSIPALNLTFSGATSHKFGTATWPTVETKAGEGGIPYWPSLLEVNAYNESGGEVDGVVGTWTGNWSISELKRTYSLVPDGSSGDASYLPGDTGTYGDYKFGITGSGNGYGIVTAVGAQTGGNGYVVGLPSREDPHGTRFEAGATKAEYYVALEMLTAPVRYADSAFDATLVEPGKTYDTTATLLVELQ